MAFIAAPVAAWAIGAGASAAVGALAGAVAVGVVSGAVIGAATAALTGGNILDGALKGAVVGGITAGVFSGLGMATGFSSAGSQLTGMGLSPTGTALTPTAGVSAAPGAVTGMATPTTTLTGPEAGLMQGTGSIPTSGVPVTPGISTTTAAQSVPTGNVPVPAKRGFFDRMLFDKEGSLSTGAGKVISGGVEGIAKGLATDTPEPESQSEYLASVQARNVAGDFQARTANIKIPAYWQRYNKANRLPLDQSTNAQLTPQQLAALNAQQQQGGAYARPA